MDHRKLCADMHEITKEGARSRRTGAAQPYPANTVQSFLFGHGWLTEDLRIALMKANPIYEKGQANFGQGLSSLPATA